MIVIKVEMWPQGDESKARELGRAEIANDGTGTATSGNYDVRLLKSGEYAKRPGIWKSGRVEGFPRMSLGPWDLLFQALRACVASRNPGRIAAPPVEASS